MPLILHPSEPSMTIRGVSVLVERRIELRETSGLSPLPKANAVPPATPSTSEGHDSDRLVRSYESDGATLAAPSTLCLTDHLPSQGAAVSTASFASTLVIGPNGTYSELPLLQSVVTNIPAKTITYNVTGMNTSGPFAKDAAGVWSKTLSFQWPAPKSHGHWAMGETMETGLARVRFFVLVKVCCTHLPLDSRLNLVVLDHRFLAFTRDGVPRLAGTRALCRLDKRIGS